MAERSGPLISGAELAPLIGSAELALLLGSARPPVVFDVRWRLAGPPGIGSYLAAHLPGAVFADVDADLAAPPGRGGRHPLPETASFEAVMRRSGLNAGCLAVAYDDADATSAARLWWLLRYHGHDQVRVLDGGFRAWAGDGRPVTAEIPRPAPGNFTARPGRLPVIEAAGAASLARAGVLLDARAAERYRGETEPVDPVAGHIPGAVSMPAAGNTKPDGRFRDPADLRARFAAAGLGFGAGGSADDHSGSGAGQLAAKAGRPAVGAYCGSGVVAAQQVLALELAGLPGAALYAGSWSDWIGDPARPVATGPDAG